MRPAPPITPSARPGCSTAGPATACRDRFKNHVARTFQVAGRGGVPSGAIAVTGNLTVTGQSAPGYLYLGPAPVNDPTSSTLNFPAGDNRANGVTVALGPARAACRSPTWRAPRPHDPGHLRRDRLLHRRCDAAPRTHAVGPTRLLDSRTGNGLTGTFKNHVAADLPGGRSGRGPERRGRGQRQPDRHRPDRPGLPVPRTRSGQRPDQLDPQLPGR